MKASIISAIAALGIVASPAFAATSTPVKTARTEAHRTVAQVCQSERAMAKAKKESWKLATQKCNAAKREAKAQVGSAKVAQHQAHTAAKSAKKS